MRMTISGSCRLMAFTASARRRCLTMTFRNTDFTIRQTVCRAYPRQTRSARWTTKEIYMSRGARASAASTSITFLSRAAPSKQGSNPLSAAAGRSCLTGRAYMSCRRTQGVSRSARRFWITPCPTRPYTFSLKEPKRTRASQRRKAT